MKSGSVSSTSSCPCCSNSSNGHVVNKVNLARPGKEVRSIRCTKLHELCVQGSALDEIRAHIGKCPLSPRSMDRFGRSPLFWAIKLKRPDVIIRHIYKAAPDMLPSPDVYGKTCLDLLYAPRTRNAPILRWLLEQDPSLVISRAPSPFVMPLLHRICIRWSLTSNVDAVDLEIVLMTIDAAHRFCCCRCTRMNNENDHPIPVLHMALDLGLPCLVLQKIATLFPDDANSCPLLSPKTPLHVFLSHYSPADDNHAIAFLIYMLDRNPLAAQECFQGATGKSTTPLHVAIQNGYAWKSMQAIERLVQAAPWVLHEADEETNLLPYQLAASTNCFVQETIHLDAIYGLLRTQPSVIHE